MSNQQIMRESKDYIVVKDHDTARGLSTSTIPSLAGKYIIVAPKGLKFISLEELLKLPQINKLLLAREQEVREEMIELYKPILRVSQFLSMPERQIPDDLYQASNKAIEKILKLKKGT